MRFSSARFIAFIVLFTFSLPTSALATKNPENQLIGAGCKTEFLLIDDLARGYESATEAVVSRKKTGNKVAVKLLAEDKIDFAFTCKPPRQLASNYKLDPEKTHSWFSYQIALDPIVVLINRDNPVVSLTLAQLQQVFSGSIQNWKDLGGDDLPIKVAYLDNSVGSGVTGVFREIVLGNSSAGEPQKIFATAFTYPGPRNLGAYVSQNPGAITFMGLNSYQRRYGVVVNIEGVAPNRENILSGRYPLTATYHIVYDRNHNKAAVQSFINYLLSDEGISITNQSFVSHIETLD